MVRTKANNAAVRKAVAAKAPRKSLGGGGVRPVSSLTSPSSRRGKKSKLGSSSNPVKSWPTPTWQKGIDIFLSSNGKEGSSSSDGCCSGSNSAVVDGPADSNSLRPEEERPLKATSDGEEREEESTTDGEEREESMTDGESEEEEDLMPESEEESEMDEEEMATSKIATLSKDIIGDSDDDD